MPFTPAEFSGVFTAYNKAVWPAQVALFGLGAALVALARFASQPVGRAVVPAGLALLWAWTGVVYHLGYFAQINPAAFLFGTAFLAQAAIWITWMWRTAGLCFRPADRMALAVGAGLLAYALVVYPALNVLFGHAYPAMPTFGAPCPITIASLGLLAWARPRPPWWVWLIPVVWALVGTTAAFALGMHEDLGLLVAAVLAIAISHRSRFARAQPPAASPRP